MFMICPPGSLTSMRSELMSGQWVLPTLNEELAAERKVVGEISHPVSPLDSLLGVVASSPMAERDASRVVSLGIATGPNWARAVLDTPPLKPGTPLESGSLHNLIAAALDKRAEDLVLLDDVVRAHRRNDVITAKLTARLNQLLESVRVETQTFNGRWQTGYRSDDLIALGGAEFVVRARDGARFEECGLCADMFVVSARSSERYCRRRAPGQPPGGRTCHDVGPQRIYTETLDELSTEYRRAYKRLDNLARRGRVSRDAVDLWRSAARSLLEEAKEGDWSVGQFVAALADLDPMKEHA